MKTNIALIVTVTLALIGYLATYLNNVLVARRRERLDLVNKQISTFYGPLYVVATVGATAYNALITKLGRENDPHLDQPLSDSEFREWRLWVMYVFMPMNEWCEKLLLENAYLLREERLPDSLHRFITHVAAYKPVVKKWQEGDFLEQHSIINFPEELLDYAATSYRELKAEQLRLIGIKRDGSEQVVAKGSKEAPNNYEEERRGRMGAMGDVVDQVISDIGSAHPDVDAYYKGWRGTGDRKEK
jgi:hypothetical protein